MFVYFNMAFLVLYKYSKKTKYKIKKNLAIGFLVLDAVVIFSGFTTDFILPHFTHFLPPMSVLAIGVFQIGYYTFIYRYDLYNIENIITSNQIIENSMNPIFLLDGAGEIIRCNAATVELFGYEKQEIVGKKFKEFLETGNYKSDLLRDIFKLKRYSGIESNIKIKSGEIKHVHISVTVVEDRMKEFLR